MISRLFGKNFPDHLKSAFLEISEVEGFTGLDFRPFASLAKASQSDLRDQVWILERRFGCKVLREGLSGVLGYFIFPSNNGSQSLVDLVVADGRVEVILTPPCKVIDESIEDVTFVNLSPWDISLSKVEPLSNLGLTGDFFFDRVAGDRIAAFYKNRCRRKDLGGFEEFLAGCHKIVNNSYELDLSVINHWYWHPWKKEIPNALISIGFSADNDVLINVDAAFDENLKFYVVNQDLHEILFVGDDFRLALDRFVAESVRSVRDSLDEGD